LENAEFSAGYKHHPGHKFVGFREGLPTLTLMEVYRRLLKHFGRQGWWPAQTKFEVLLGAVLTQRTRWENAEKAVQRLREAGLLDPRKLADTPIEVVEELIRPSGFYRVKARRLLNLVRHIAEKYEGNLDRFLGRPAEEVRRDLLTVGGVGRETADSILLYAAERLYFPVDAYTKRIMRRLGFIEDENVDYEELRRFIESRIPRSLDVYREFRALLVALGKHHCGKEPRCVGCPLRDLCPTGGGGVEEARN